ncbi:MAG TPA: hypothetical protein PKH77_09415 [Anaerolineae bacterium]|nr:hypothetical protein [Anaerolineae bacterium]
MKTLVVIPCLQHKYTFSAPLAWMFSRHVDCVEGIYSFSLDKETVQKYDSFIVELNWFIELYEFQLIAQFIKKYNPRARILFGGLYSQLKYKEVFQHAPVDYFIKGDNEVPIQQFVEGVDPRKIPNMVGRDFENPQTYAFQQEDYPSLEFNLDWFPDFAKYWPDFPHPGVDIAVDFSRMPLYPKYWEKPGRDLPPQFEWRIPPRGGRYHLPMLITSRGACLAAHETCDYCMGSRHELSQAIYKRPPLVIDNETCILLLKKIEKKFKQATLFINGPFIYDFSNEHFDLEATIEIDGPSTAQDVAKILPAFRDARVHTAIYAEGDLGTKIREDLDQYDALEDESHKIYFFAFPEDAANYHISESRRLYAELVLPDWTDWNFYNDWDKAMGRSRRWYFSTRQDNFYPPPRKIITRIVQFIFTYVAYVLQRLKIIDLKEKFVL